MLRSWDQVLSTGDTNAYCKQLAMDCTHRISDEALRSRLLSFLDRSDYYGLCNDSIDYRVTSAGDARMARQVLAMYQKREDLDIGVDKAEAARFQFQASERLCAETNHIFRLWGSGSFQFEPDVERVFFYAQRKIATLLGDVPNLSDIKGRFGPGATTQVIKRTASARKKLSQTFACSEDFVPLVREALEELPAWTSPYFEGESDTASIPVEIHHGVLHFVPKNAKTYRSVVVEPSLNSFFQLGVGDLMADKLRSVGIDITDQSRNQQLAKEGSVTGALATLDLSSASDTIARELVAHLLPIDWFQFLDRLRTGSVLVDGEPVKLHKFSSMGNGFTFPLETLIFWALSACTTARDEVCSVYGDDIIVPTTSVPLLSKVLTAAGFKLNTLKSYWCGPFRESCGKDYYSGMLIRPVYLKNRLSGESAFVMHNHFVRSGLPDFAQVVRSWLDPSFILEGPDGYGDGHLLSDRDLTPHRRALAKSPRTSSMWSGYIFDTYSWKGRKDFVPYKNDFVFPGYTIYLGSSATEVLSCETPDRLFPLLVRDAQRAKKIWGKPQVAALIKRLTIAEGGCSSYRRGLLGTTIPGKQGYKRISIYTLTS